MSIPRPDEIVMRWCPDCGHHFLSEYEPHQAPTYHMDERDYAKQCRGRTQKWVYVPFGCVVEEDL